MDKVFEFCIEKLVYLVLSVCVIVTTVIGKPKTAEKIKQLKDKHKKKLCKKASKQAKALEKTTTKIEEIEKE